MRPRRGRPGACSADIRLAGSRFVGESEQLRRLVFPEINHHCGLVANRPCIVTRTNDNHVSEYRLISLTVRRQDAETAPNHDPNVHLHAPGRSGLLGRVDRPAPTRRVFDPQHGDATERSHFHAHPPTGDLPAGSHFIEHDAIAHIPPVCGQPSQQGRKKHPIVA